MINFHQEKIPQVTEDADHSVRDYKILRSYLGSIGLSNAKCLSDSPGRNAMNYLKYTANSYIEEPVFLRARLKLILI